MNLSEITVFLLEDEPIIAFALEDMLAAEGARTMLATTLEDAGALIDECTFDCGILDVNVHGQKSYQLAEVLQSRGIPFVFATGYDSTGHPEVFASVRTLSKPYSPAQIREAIATLA